MCICSCIGTRNFEQDVDFVSIRSLRGLVHTVKPSNRLQIWLFFYLNKAFAQKMNKSCVCNVALFHTSNNNKNHMATVITNHPCRIIFLAFIVLPIECSGYTNKWLSLTKSPCTANYHTSVWFTVLGAFAQSGETKHPPNTEYQPYYRIADIVVCSRFSAFAL